MKRFGKGEKGVAPPPPPPPMPSMPTSAPATPSPPPPDNVPAVEEQPASDAEALAPEEISPEPIQSIGTEKTSDSKRNRFNRLLQSAKPAASKLFQGLPVLRRDARDESGSKSSAASASALPNPKAERRAAQQAEYETALAEWERERKYKMNEAERHNLPFDESELRARPSPPVFDSDSDSDSVPHSDEEDNGPVKVTSSPPPLARTASAFRPVEPSAVPTVVPEGQSAGAVAEHFAAKAYGIPVNPAAVPGSIAPKNSIFSSASGPMLPPGAKPVHAPDTRTMKAPPSDSYSTAMPSMYQSNPPPPVAPGAARLPTWAQGSGGPPPSMPTSFGGGMQFVPRQPLPQSNTYIDPALANRIRRGRELEKLGIDEEERGNMGHAQAAYMKALELIIPSIPGLDHGNDVSYTYRMGEKKKLETEAGLMLDRCEEIKQFLLLNSATVPLSQPKKFSQMTRKGRNDDDGDSNGGGNLPTKSTGKGKITPLAPPPSSLLEGFSGLSLKDPLAQQHRPMYPQMPAPMPSALPTSALHAPDAGQSRVSGTQRQEMLSRPPGIGGSTPPAMPKTSSALSTEPLHPAQFDDADPHPNEATEPCHVCKKAPSSLVGKCKHVYCAPCGNRSSALGWCLQPDCSARLKPEDIRHIMR